VALQRGGGVSALSELSARLRQAPGVLSKLCVQSLSNAFGTELHSAWINPGSSLVNGDDAAVIPDGHGYLLFAAEGIIPEFIRRDPWFAGYCSVMVNVNDIAAMGGIPFAVTDVLLSSDEAAQGELLRGMRDASRAFGVPVVGGHTGRTTGETFLAVSIVGRAQALLSSFGARAGYALVAAVDLRGQYRGEYSHFDAATTATPDQLRRNVSLLSELAEAGLAVAAKDVSQAGFAGTLAMLCETSNVGATLQLSELPTPNDVELYRWLTTFPSYGFLLASRPDKVDALIDTFQRQGITAAEVGHFIAEPRVYLVDGRHKEVFWDFGCEMLTGMGRLGCAERDSRGVCKKAS
jgi:AIR synthase-related protein